jgi:hypothetical protein
MDSFEPILSIIYSVFYCVRDTQGSRRTFALNMLRSGVDIFVLQGLMGHADLYRRYLAQSDEDNQVAHMHGGPVDNNLGIQALCRTACDLRFYLPRDFQNWMSPSR